MNRNQMDKSLPRLFPRILLAGLAGGLAEVLWVGFYSALPPVSGSVIAREITATVFPALADAPLAPALGVSIHLALSLALAVAFAWMVWLPLKRRYDTAVIVMSAVVVLVVVWTINFLVLLPVLNPAFVVLLPYSVTLASKTLFGLAMGVVLVGWGARPLRTRVLGAE